MAKCTTVQHLGERNTRPSLVHTPFAARTTFHNLFRGIAQGNGAFSLLYSPCMLVDVISIQLNEMQSFMCLPDPLKPEVVDRKWIGASKQL